MHVLLIANSSAEPVIITDLGGLGVEYRQPPCR